MVIYVDVDDTFVRSYGTKRIPVPAVIRHIRALHEEGATLYCWSSGGADYARESAEEFGLADRFTAFLPKAAGASERVRGAGGRAARGRRECSMNEVMTRAEMEARFDGEWVLIAEPEVDSNLEVLRGRVVSHGQDPEAVYQEAIDQRISRWASLYFGPMPEASVLLNIWA